MPDIICSGAVLVILGLAIAYIVKAKRSGVKCIGCSAGDSCSGGCAGCNCTIEIADIPPLDHKSSKN